MKVFLGGTRNDSPWRTNLINMFIPSVDYVNPVIDDAPRYNLREEERHKESCDIYLYVLTPLLVSMGTIAEMIDDSHRHPDKVIFTYLRDDGYSRFSDTQWREMDKIADIAQNSRKVPIFTSLKKCADYINGLSNDINSRTI